MGIYNMAWVLRFLNSDGLKRTNSFVVTLCFFEVDNVKLLGMETFSYRKNKHNLDECISYGRPFYVISIVLGAYEKSFK